MPHRMRRRRTGARLDRVFKLYFEMPVGVPEDDVMKYIEDAVKNHRVNLPYSPVHDFNSACVSVRRMTPKYAVQE